MLAVQLFLDRVLKFEIKFYSIGIIWIMRCFNHSLLHETKTVFLCIQSILTSNLHGCHTSCFSIVALPDRSYHFVLIFIFSWLRVLLQAAVYLTMLWRCLNSLLRACRPSFRFNMIDSRSDAARFVQCRTLIYTCNSWIYPKTHYVLTVYMSVVA